MKFANCVYFSITRGKALPHLDIMTFRRYQNLRYFSTKLHYFTKFRMRIPAVLMNFLNSKVCLIGEWSKQKKRKKLLKYRPIRKKLLAIEVARTEKSCSKRKKLLLISFRAQSGHAYLPYDKPSSRLVPGYL